MSVTTPLGTSMETVSPGASFMAEKTSDWSSFAAPRNPMPNMQSTSTDAVFTASAASSVPQEKTGMERSVARR